MGFQGFLPISGLDLAPLRAVPKYIDLYLPEPGAPLERPINWMPRGDQIAIARSIPATRGCV